MNAESDAGLGSVQARMGDNEGKHVQNIQEMCAEPPSAASLDLPTITSQAERLRFLLTHRLRRPTVGPPVFIKVAESPNRAVPRLLSSPPFGDHRDWPVLAPEIPDILQVYQPPDVDEWVDGDHIGGEYDNEMDDCPGLVSAHDLDDIHRQVFYTNDQYYTDSLQHIIMGRNVATAEAQMEEMQGETHWVPHAQHISEVDDTGRMGAKESNEIARSGSKRSRRPSVGPSTSQWIP
jgi:hypothetical protein